MIISHLILVVLLEGISSVQPCTLPANDDVCDGTPLTLGVQTTYNNTCATPQTGEVTPETGSNPSVLPVSFDIGPCRQQNGWCFFETSVQNSVWFTFVAPTSGCVSIETDNGDDLQQAVYEVDMLVTLAASKRRPPMMTHLRPLGQAPISQRRLTLSRA
jgi:hypothetical protein